MQFTSTDAGYTATDYALSVILNKPECRWITVSNADNAYGTHIVDNVHKGWLEVSVFFLYLNSTAFL